MVKFLKDNKVSLSKPKQTFKHFLNDLKAQTAIEVIIIAAIVIVLVTVIGFYLKRKTVEITADGNDDLNNVLNQAAGDI